MAIQRHLPLVTKAVLLIGGMTYLLRQVDLDALGSALLSYRSPKLIVWMAWFLLSFCFLGLRLYLLTRGKSSLINCIRASFMGFFANCVLPVRMGEGVKGLYLLRSSPLTPAGVFSIIFWERFADLNLLMVLPLITVGILGIFQLYWILAVAVFGIWGVLFWIKIRCPSDRPDRKQLPFRWAEKLAGYLSTGLDKSTLFLLLMVTLLVWGQYVLEMILILYWITGLHIPLSAALTVFVLGVLALSVPFSPGGLGAFDAVLIFSLGLYGIEASEAAAIDLLIRALQYIPTLSIGFITLMIARGPHRQRR